MANTKELFNSLVKAQKKMVEAQAFPYSEPMREAAIQRFEYTFELSWKVMNSILFDQGMATAGVRNIIRAAAQLGLITSPIEWLEYAEARNLTSHVYKDDIAEKVYRIAIGKFPAGPFRHLFKTLPVSHLTLLQPRL